MKNMIVIGAGPAGIGAAYSLKKQGINPVVYDSRNSYGGLCNNFTVKGFRFDQFIHLSFSKIDEVNKHILSTPYLTHSPLAYNYYFGHWLKHPAQNNLFNLPEEIKKEIITGFANRNNKLSGSILNYKDWLRSQYGDYFSENFAEKYTKKYWTTDAENLSVKWVGSRMYKPTLKEIEDSCYEEKTPNTYYAKEMRYPKTGGYKEFFSNLAKNIDFRFNKQVIEIDITKKLLVLADGESVGYRKELFSSIPLPEYAHLIKNCPSYVEDACRKLAWTQGIIVSIGFNKSDIAKHLWFYIYNEDILASRVHSPSLKSPDNVPEGCSSIQAEIFFSKKYHSIDMSLEEIRDKTIKDLSRIMSFNIESDVVVTDVRFEPYANIIFDHDVYKNRNIIKKYLKENGIIPIGRFGEWEYLWSDQSCLSGIKKAKKYG